MRADPSPGAATLPQVTSSAEEPGRLPLSEALVAEITAVAGLDRGLTWRDLGGSWTTNLHAHTDDPTKGTVYRVHQPVTTRERVDAEQQVRRHLADGGIPTVEPSTFRDGDTCAELSSGRVVEAEPFVAASGWMSTAEAMVTGFGVLGLLHHSLARARLPAAAATVAYANHVPAEDALVLATAGAERVRGWGDPRLLRYAGEVVDHLAEVSAGEGQLLGGQRRQLVHGDFWDNNVLFSGGAVAAVLDFGFMAERTRIDDLALAIWFWLLGTEEPPPGSSDLDLVSALVAAYDRHTDPLTEEERLALPLAVARQPAWSLGRWVLELPEPEAVQHARAAADELSAARAVLRNLDRWQSALVG